MKYLYSVLRSQDKTLTYSVAGLVVLLLCKFLYPLFAYDAPLGYDPGIYRYLLLRYADAVSSFSLPVLDPWAQEYPRAFYVLMSPLLIAGVPVDAVIGWMWNLVPVVLAGTLAWVTAKRSDAETGAAVLLIALLSQPYYDGFFAMYIKVYVSLIFVVITYHLVERMSLWFPAAALVAVLLHQQTGLVLTLALAVWWLLQLRTRWSEKRFRTMTIVLATVGALGILAYLPQWERAIWSPLKSIFLLRGEDAPAGAFPEASFYVRTMAVVFLLGIGGFLNSFCRERASLWQLSVVICLLFIALRLVFYKRFLLLLDFFLLPYAAAMLVALWRKLEGNVVLRGALVVLITAQLLIGWHVVKIRKPSVKHADIVRIEKARAYLSEGASIIALENLSGTWMRGWIPGHTVGAPGLFDYPNWSYEKWQKFIDGTNADRKELLSMLEGDVYFFVTPIFTGYYGPRAQKVLSDPCLKQVPDSPLLQSLCSS